MVKKMGRSRCIERRLSPPLVAVCVACCCLILAGLYVSAVFGAETLSLNEVIALALQQDAQARAETWAARAARAEGAGLVAGYGPRLAASGDLLHSNERLTGGLDDPERRADFTESSWRLSFSQPLFDAEKFAAARRGLREMAIGDLSERQAKEDVLLRAHERYYQTLAARQKLVLAENESAALREQVEHAKSKLDLGAGTITDQDNAQARWSLALAAEIAAGTEYENAKKALIEIICRDFTELRDIDEDGPLPAPGESLDYWLGRAEERNAELAISMRRLQAAEMLVTEKRGRFLPNLAVVVEYSDRDPSDGLASLDEARREFRAGLRLQMDILAGGVDAAAAVAASRRRDEAEAKLAAVRLSLKRSVSSLWDSLSDTEKLIAACQKAVAASGRALDSTRAAHDEGVGTLLDVLNAQREYFQTLGRFRAARYDYLILFHQFQKATGAMSE